MFLVCKSLYMVSGIWAAHLYSLLEIIAAHPFLRCSTSSATTWNRHKSCPRNLPRSTTLGWFDGRRTQLNAGRADLIHPSSLGRMYMCGWCWRCTEWERRGEKERERQRCWRGVANVNAPNYHAYVVIRRAQAWGRTFSCAQLGISLKCSDFIWPLVSFWCFGRLLTRSCERYAFCADDICACFLLDQMLRCQM